jgi:hypothetical protein
VQVYDENVQVDQLIGANKSFLEREIPHIASLMRHSLAEIVAAAEVIVVGNANPAFAQIFDWVRPDQTVVDLVGIDQLGSDQAGLDQVASDQQNGQRGRTRVGGYHGICW